MKVNLRKLARGQQCQERLVEDDGTRICNYDSSTVVLAHLRRGGGGGMGRKPPDLAAVYLCSNCHDVVDARVVANIKNLDGDILNALCRTLAIVSKELDLG